MNIVALGVKLKALGFGGGGGGGGSAEIDFDALPILSAPTGNEFFIVQSAGAEVSAKFWRATFFGQYGLYGDEKPDKVPIISQMQFREVAGVEQWNDGGTAFGDNIDKDPPTEAFKNRSTTVGGLANDPITIGYEFPSAVKIKQLWVSSIEKQVQRYFMNAKLEYSIDGVEWVEVAYADYSFEDWSDFNVTLDTPPPTDATSKVTLNTLAAFLAP